MKQSKIFIIYLNNDNYTRCKVINNLIKNHYEKKIVIVVALGYLGTELCKIYSGESWRNKIMAIDSRFVSERVSQLINWNIQFFQGHILDLDFLKKHLHDADIVHHLAGVTDVAQAFFKSKMVPTISLNIRDHSA
jgi:UDP-glucose 4-epimerase|tara:strand:- start:97 stop:501 length:405 start_codon:yes stop_codon:yes gene_type:complete